LDFWLTSSTIVVLATKIMVVAHCACRSDNPVTIVNWDRFHKAWNDHLGAVRRIWLKTTHNPDIQIERGEAPIF
jgi:hypothetical protein